MADLYGERFVGLLPKTDFTAEVGARRQIDRTVVLEAAVGRHFAGNATSWQLTAGFTHEVVLRF